MERQKNERMRKYYLRMRPDNLGNLDVSTSEERILKRNFDRVTADRLLKRIRSEYEALIPQVPFVGENHRFLPFLIRAAQFLPVFRNLEKEGVPFREIYRIVYEMFKDYYESVPEKERDFGKETFFSEANVEEERKHAKTSQRKEWPVGWVTEFSEGDGENFDFATTYHQCALMQFYDEQGAGKYKYCLCLSDYALGRAWGVGYRRTKTLGGGGGYCDYRYKKEWETPEGWPPEDLEEPNPFKE